MIPEHLVRDLRYVELRAARRIRSLRTGTYTSPHRGEGFDFDQHRAYRPGDDVRRIDWNATARFGTAFLRQTHAERELNVIVAVDVSGSMRYVSNGRSKREALTLATASLLFSAVADQINTGFLAFSDRVLKWSPPSANAGRAWATLSELWALDPGGSQTRLVPAITHLLRHLKRTTLVFLVSDFLTDDHLSEASDLAMLASRHDVVAVVLEDPAETRLPAGAGHVRVRDLESGHEATVALNDALRHRYAETVQQHRRELSHLFYGNRIDHVVIDISGEVVEPLMAMFDRRRHQ